MARMTVLYVEPFEEPRVVEIEHSLDAMQELVGGWIEAIYPFDDPVAIVCDDEAKLKGAEVNRLLRDDKGKVYDAICGSFFICGLDGEDFGSLPQNLIEKYKKMFYYPVLFW